MSLGRGIPAAGCAMGAGLATIATASDDAGFAFLVTCPLSVAVFVIARRAGAGHG